MKRLLCAVAAIALMAPAAAAAQQRNDHQNSNRTQRSQSRPIRERQQNRQSRPARVTRVTRPARTVERTRPMSTRQVARSLPVYRPGHRPATFHRIQAQAFSYPRGYRYRRFRNGSILPRLFLSSLYFWTDWAALGVGPPPPGYVWVRYGPDLLLVNRYTGRIADVIYGAFY
jgi:Ni/Co efflux regulator RcnB